MVRADSKQLRHEIFWLEIKQALGDEEDADLYFDFLIFFVGSLTESTANQRQPSVFINGGSTVVVWCRH